VRWKIILGIALLAGVAVSLGFFWPFHRAPLVLRLPGVVEIQEVRLSSKIGGRVEKVGILEGAIAEPRQILVTIEVPELKAQHQQLQARLDSAREQLAKLQAMPRPEEVPASEARVKAAQSQLALMEDQFKRAQRLVANRAIGDEEFRQRQIAYAQAQAQLDQAEADCRLLKAGAWEYDKRMARASIAEVAGKLAENEANLAEAEVRAPERVLVEVVAVRKGDVVAPNQPIIRVLRADDLWVKVYVPETELGKVYRDQEVAVTVDAYPDKQFHGRVYFVASESEFTPRNVQSADERRHQVFGIRVRVADPQGVFKSGMAAEVTINLRYPAAGDRPHE
jgi:HlyD family secretion protein